MGKIKRALGVAGAGTAIAGVGAALIVTGNLFIPERSGPEDKAPPATTPATATAFGCAALKLIETSRNHYTVTVQVAGEVPDDARLSVFADYDGKNKDKTVTGNPGEWSVAFSEFRYLERVDAQIVSSAGNAACGSELND